MATFYSPKVVTDGLQIYVDFANSKSYAGGGANTVNLIDSSRNPGYIKGTVTDSTVNNNRVVLTGGGGAGYNLVGDRISINTSAAGIDRFGKQHSFSICFWVKKSGGGGKIWSTGSAGSGTTDNCVWQMWIDEGQFYWWDIGGGGTNIVNVYFSPVPDATNWYFNTITFSSGGAGNNNVCVAYRDAVAQNSQTIAYNTHSAVDRSGETSIQWTLGGGYSGSCYTGNGSYYFGSYFCYNKVLTPAEILQTYNTTKGRFGK